MLPWRPALKRERVPCGPESPHDSQPRPRHYVSRERHVSCSSIYHTLQELLAQIDNTSLEQEQLRELPSPDEATVTYLHRDWFRSF